MMEAGLTLMLVGMGTVFLFLVILVLVMMGMATFFTTFAHLFPEAQPATKARATTTDEPAQIAIAIAAVKALNS
jgi:sodium pump decarboxylase gamma subunit